MTIDICKIKALELKLAWELGTKNVQVIMGHKNYCVLVRNHFGVTSYVFPYDKTDFKEVMDIIQRDYIMVRNNY